MGICDFHCHLLPGIDDGYLSREGFLRMLSLYRECGITTIAFTPHIYNPFVATNIKDLRPTYAWAQQEAQKLGIATYLGSELYVAEQDILKAVPINNRYALVEFGLSLPPSHLLPRLKQLKQQNLTLIIAHVERYLWLEPKSAMLQKLLDLGCLLQTNVESVENKVAFPYLQAGLIDLIATDNHGDETLPLRMMQVLNEWPDVYHKMEKMW